MRTLAFVVALSIAGLLASEAGAVTVLNTTQDSVKKQCAGQTKCSAACGGTLCDYVCDNPAKQCTVAIFMKAPKQGHRPTTPTKPVARAPGAP